MQIWITSRSKIYAESFYCRRTSSSKSVRICHGRGHILVSLFNNLLVLYASVISLRIHSWMRCQIVKVNYFYCNRKYKELQKFTWAVLMWMWCFFIFYLKDVLQCVVWCKVSSVNITSYRPIRKEVNLKLITTSATAVALFLPKIGWIWYLKRCYYGWTSLLTTNHCSQNLLTVDKSQRLSEYFRLNISRWVALKCPQQW